MAESEFPDLGNHYDQIETVRNDSSLSRIERLKLLKDMWKRMEADAGERMENITTDGNEYVRRPLFRRIRRIWRKG